MQFADRSMQISGTCSATSCRRPVGMLLLASMIMLFAQGCGYTVSGSKDPGVFPAGINTVAVPIAENRTFYRGVEFDVTEALIKEIELRTPYKVTGPDTADTILRLTIIAIDQKQLARRETGGVPQEVEVRMVVDLEWRNQRTGEVLRRREGLAKVGRYVPARPVGQTYEFAQHQAAVGLAEEIISVMRADW